jgi:ABC-type glycerol-3-phosphate transport system substrate-binding protein
VGLSVVRALVAVALLGGLLAGCAATATQSSGPTASAAAPQGRSRCAGSVPVVLTNLQGAAANTLEQLQGTYEAKPGFLAVVFDGTKAVVVVEAARLPAWLADLTPNGIAVAPGCVDPALLDAVKAAVPALTPADGISSAGYNGLNDGA